jgi:hypothetical protein
MVELGNISPYPKVVIVTALKYKKFHIGYLKLPLATPFKIIGALSGKDIEFSIRFVK